MSNEETPAKYFAHALETCHCFPDTYEGDVSYTITCLLDNDADAGMPRSADFAAAVREAHSEHRYTTDASLPEAVEHVRAAASRSEGAFAEATWWVIREMSFTHENDPGLVYAKAMDLGPVTSA